MRMLAPAKVNLFLRIVGVRDDGYHLLDSLMVPVSLCDDIHMTVQNISNRNMSDHVATREQAGQAGQAWQIRVACDEPSIPSDETNLAYRAAALVCQEARVSAQIAININIEKRIPSGAGLGGGSSDAAAVLNGLNAALGLHWTPERLCTLGLRLGADVPFFIGCQAARVGGIGEELTPIALSLERWLVLVVPPFGVSTPWAYRRFDELPTQGPAPMSVAAFYRSNSWPRPEQYINDLERAVMPTHPAIPAIKAALLTCQAEAALMSGSGSSVFGVFRDKNAAEQAAVTLARQERKLGRMFCVKVWTGGHVEG